MRLQIGTSSLVDLDAAVDAAARGALAGCGSPTVAFVLSTVEYAADEVASAMNLRLGALPWVGLVTPAVLVGRTILRRGVAVGVIDGDGARVGVGLAGLTSADPRDAGRRAARAALLDLPPPPPDRRRAMLLFADTDRADVAEVVHGALSVAGAGVAWSGGATSGGAGTVAFGQGRALLDHVVVVALDCRARFGVGIKHGWQPTGAPAMVTRAQGCVLERLEHLAALEIYRAAAADRGQSVEGDGFAAFALAHPLGIPQADGEYLIRDPLDVDARGALRFMASVPDGALVRVMEGTPTMLIEAARVAASMAREDARGPLGGALLFDCVSRDAVLGERLRDELGATHDALGGDVPLLGCLTFGEVGAFGSRLPQFHNKTAVVLTLPAGP